MKTMSSGGQLGSEKKLAPSNHNLLAVSWHGFATTSGRLTTISLGWGLSSRMKNSLLTLVGWVWWVTTADLGWIQVKKQDAAVIWYILVQTSWLLAKAGPSAPTKM